MSKLNKILLIMVVVLLISLGVILYWQKFGFEETYWAVYLDTGDIYFGKISHFPKFSLKDVYYFQRDASGQQNLSVSKFENSFWGPENKMYLNDDKIIWKVKLKKDSQLLNYIKNPQAFQQSQIQQSGQSVSSSTIVR